MDAHGCRLNQAHSRGGRSRLTGLVFGFQVPSNNSQITHTGKTPQQTRTELVAETQRLEEQQLSQQEQQQDAKTKK
jgi:hypothetical protein